MNTLKNNWLRTAAVVMGIMLLSGCGAVSRNIKPADLNGNEKAAAARLNISEDELAVMKAKPLFQFTEHEIDVYLGYLQAVEPSLRKRVQHLARKNLGQPYQLFVLGEHPFELYDREPLYSIGKGDCVVHSEHMYAMALAHDWRSFFVYLQRIRYRNGEIGNLTRNHYTVADWDRNNSWLLEDRTEQLLGETAARDTMVINRAGFFKKWNIGQDLPADTVAWKYIPYQKLHEVIDALQPGDFVNIVRGNDNSKYVGHVGLITRDGDQVNFLHSTWPKSKEQRLMELVETAETYNAERKAYNLKAEQENRAIRAHNQKVESTGKGKRKKLKAIKPYFYGFKFFRLRDDALDRLKAIDGPEGARIFVRTPWEF